MHEITGRLEKWVYDERGIIWGNLFADVKSRWPVGTWVHTSFIPDHETMEFKEGDEVRTLNSIYLLGKPAE